MIDKQSPIPMYIQIEEGLKSRIEDGELIAGTLIPSERELTEMFQVSRMTVRQAITNLVNEGLLYREKGKGTFVAAPKLEQRLNGMTSFTEDMQARGLIPSNKLISFKKILPAPDIAKLLLLSPEEQTFFIERVRYANAEPMAIERTFVPAKIFPHLNQENFKGSFYSLIEQDPFLTISHASQRIEAALVKKEDAEFLDIEMPSAVLVIERISHLTNGLPFEVVHSTYRADRYKFVTEIHKK
jgi:GntR family transcriptional regulator